MAFPSKVRVKDIMTRRVISVATTSSMKDVLDEMVRNEVSGVVVLDEKGFTSGIISFYDLIAAVENRPRGEVQRLKAGDLMTKYVFDVDPEDPVEKAAGIMREFKVHRLVIGTKARPQEQVPVGIITSTDILRFMHKSLFLG